MIALENSADLSLSNQTSKSQSYTCTGSDLYLICVMGAEDGTSNDRLISTITYNSVGLSQLAQYDNGSNDSVEIWGLAGPATGSNTLTITYQGAVFTAEGSIMSFTGVASAGQPDATASNNGSGTSVDTNINTLTADSVIIEGVHKHAGSGNISSVDSGQSIVRNFDGGSHDVLTAYEIVTTAQLYTQSSTLSVSSTWGHALVALKPVAAGGANAMPMAMDHYRRRKT